MWLGLNSDHIVCGVELICFGIPAMPVGGSLNIPYQYGLFVAGVQLVVIAICDMAT